MTIRTKTDCKMLECCLNSNRKCFQSTKPLVTHSRLMIHARVVNIRFQCLESLFRERKNTNIILSGTFSGEISAVSCGAVFGAKLVGVAARGTIVDVVFHQVGVAS